MAEIIEVDFNNKYLLDDFIKNKLPGTFRYFNKRNSDIIKNHIITVILLLENKSIGYAHIDYDKEYWFGICILEEYQGNGYGKKLIDYILKNKKVENINKIYLTVDKINKIAIKLYNSFGFKIEKEMDTCLLMVRNKN